MFALIATVQATNANSYLTDTEADTYFESQLFVDSWDNESQSVKQKALVLATKYIDQEYFAGVKSTQTQSLEFPRIGVVNKQGYYVDNTTIPQALKDATCELAIFIIEEGKRQNVHQDSKIESYNLDGISVVVDTKFKLPKSVMACLAQIGPGVVMAKRPIRLIK